MPYTIKHDRENCIGCGACPIMAPDFWEMDDDGKSNLINSKDNERVIDDKDFNANLEAAESCPVEVIHIMNNETKEKII